MSKLITVEDYNSAMLNYNDNFLYEVDCNKLYEEGLDKDEFYYDFLHVTKNSSLNFNISVDNPLWTGGFLPGDLNGYETFPSFKVFLKDVQNKGSFYLEIGNHTFGERELYVIMGITQLLNKVFFKQNIKTFKFEVPGGLRFYPFKLHLKAADDTEIELTDPTIEVIDGHRFVTFEYESTAPLKDVVKLEYDRGAASLFAEHTIKEIKNPNFLNITGNLYIGKADNTLTIEPFFTGMQCRIKYLNKEQTFTLQETNEVNIDLSDKTDIRDLSLTVEISEGLYSNNESLTYKIPVEYQTISTLSDLANELSQNAGETIIRLGANITATSTTTIPINRNVIVYGGNKSINLDKGNFSLKEGVTVKWYNTQFNEGDNTFVQNNNSTLELYECTFDSCTSSNNEGLGSCISCNIDLESLNIPYDFTTLVQGCNFNDCHGALFHGGELVVNNSHYTLNDSSVMNPNAPYFLYQTDGTASITGSVFDVDLVDDDYFCTNEINASLGQCLFVLGEDAMINNQISSDLSNPNNCNFIENNQSHVFMKYYYPLIETCVFISPSPQFELKSLCYALTDTDYIYKRNVQITRAAWGTENTSNPLRRSN